MRLLGSREWTAEQTMGLSGVLGNMGSSQEGYLPILAYLHLSWPISVHQSLASPSFLPFSSKLLFFGLFPLPFPVFKNLSVPLLLIWVSCSKENWVGGNLDELRSRVRGVHSSLGVLVPFQCLWVISPSIPDLFFFFFFKEQNKQVDKLLSYASFFSASIRCFVSFNLDRKTGFGSNNSF